MHHWIVSNLNIFNIASHRGSQAAGDCSGLGAKESRTLVRVTSLSHSQRDKKHPTCSLCWVAHLYMHVFLRQEVGLLCKFHNKRPQVRESNLQVSYCTTTVLTLSWFLTIFNNFHNFQLWFPRVVTITEGTFLTFRENPNVLIIYLLSLSGLWSLCHNHVGQSSSIIDTVNLIHLCSSFNLQLNLPNKRAELWHVSQG